MRQFPLVEDSDSEIEILHVGPSLSTKRLLDLDDSDIEILSSVPVKQKQKTTATPSDYLNVVLSPEQRAILEKVKSGKSVFFTGSAGNKL
jgi:hypothetical protein